MKRGGVFRTGLRLVGSMVVLMAGVVLSVAAPVHSASPPIRICADHVVSGSDWSPDQDDLVTDVVADLMRRSAYDLRDVVVFSFEDMYDGIGAAQPLCDVLQADWLLQAWVHRNSDRSYQVTIELRARTGSEAPKTMTSGSGSREQLAALLAQIVTELLEEELNRQVDSVLMKHFAEYRLYGHHVELAEARILRSLGRRYGGSREQLLLSLSQRNLNDVERGRVEQARKASYFEILELLASSFRKMNITFGDDDRFRESGREWIERAEAIGQTDHPEILIWKGIYGVFNNNSKIEPFNRAVDDRADKDNNPMREGRVSAQAYLNRGLFLERMLGAHEAARDDFRKAVELNPTMLRATAYLVRTAPDLAVAREEWNRSRTKVRPNGLVTYQLAWKSWKEFKKPEEAIMLIDSELIGKDDGFDDGDAYLLKANIQMDSDRWEDAEKTLLIALKEVPQWIGPLGDVGPLGESIAGLIDKYDEAVQRGAGTERFANIQNALTEFLVARGGATPIEQSFLGLVAARAGDADTAVQIAESLKMKFPRQDTAQQRMLRIAIAQTYNLIERGLSAKAAQSAIDTRRD